MNYDSNTRNWKPWRWIRLDLIFSMRDVYINPNLNPLTKFTNSSRSTELKDIPLSIGIVISYTIKLGIPLWIWWKFNGNWDNKTIRISQWRESHSRTNTSVRGNKEVQKSRTMRITVWDPRRKVNHLIKVIWDRKIIRVHQTDQFHKNR